MKLSKLEQESIILYNEEESTASIYTHDPKLKRKLKRLAEKYPDKVYPDKAVHAGAVSYAVPKSCVSVREPFSDERRRAASKRAKNAGYTPPARSKSDILLHKAAKNAFDELGVKKLPTVKSLQEEYAKLLAEKKAAYAEYRRSRDEMRELLLHKQNVDRMLGKDERSEEKKQEHDRQ